MITHIYNGRRGGGGGVGVGAKGAGALHPHIIQMGQGQSPPTS